MTEYIAPTAADLTALIGENGYNNWVSLCERIDSLYDMDRQFASGGKRWTHEYKYRRGGKTLCALYAKENCAGFMVILGKVERAGFEAARYDFSPTVQRCYDQATTYHDGKWIMFPLDSSLYDDYVKLLKIKRKPNK